MANGGTMRSSRPAVPCRSIGFVVLGAAYSLAFWALQGWQLWPLLQRLL